MKYYVVYTDTQKPIDGQRCRVDCGSNLQLALGERERMKQFSGIEHLRIVKR